MYVYIYIYRYIYIHTYIYIYIYIYIEVSVVALNSWATLGIGCYLSFGAPVVSSATGCFVSPAGTRPFGKGTSFWPEPQPLFAPRRRRRGELQPRVESRFAESAANTVRTGQPLSPPTHRIPVNYRQNRRGGANPFGRAQVKWPVGERTPTHPRQIAVRFPETNVSLKARTQNGPPEILPDPTRDPRGDPGREARSHGIRAATLPLFAALAAPGPGKPAPTLEREANSTGMKAKRHGSVR